MPKPREIPGFYFDEEKNRYFPIKGPIPGRGPKRPPCTYASTSEGVSTSSSCTYLSNAASSRHQIKLQKGQLRNTDFSRKRMRSIGLLHARELHGRLVSFKENRFKFEEEYEKVKVCNPVVYKYEDTGFISESALQQFNALVQTSEGVVEGNVLSMGSMAGSVSLYEVDDLGRDSRYGRYSMPRPVWPSNLQSESESNIVPQSLWSSQSAKLQLPSSISSILKIGRHYHDTADHHNALVTTLGSGSAGGSVYVLNLHEALDFRTDVFAHQRASKVASFDSTLWTATCNSVGTQVALGTSRGASLLNLETGRLSSLYHANSDIFSQQFDQSGNVVLCGLRNGLIVAVDVRQKHFGCLEHNVTSSRYMTRPASNLMFLPRMRSAKKPKMKSPRYQSAVMSSAVCSLVSLHSDEQYFLASSMDGSIKLLDKRLLHRGAVQSYEGHVNSHSLMQLGVNPSETLVMSGGVDCYLRIWSIKSGELLFAENVSQSILKAVCWPQNGDFLNGLQGPFPCAQSVGENLSFGVWLGSREGLFSLHV